MGGLYMSQRRHKEKEALMTSKEDIRDNVIHYNDEGGGEQDTRAYDMGTLRTSQSQRTSIQSAASTSRKDRPCYGEGVLLHLSSRENELIRSPDIHRQTASAILAANKSSTLRRGKAVTGDNAEIIRSFIEQRLGEGQHAAPAYDSLATYAYEGEGSEAGSLSSIEESWVMEDMGDFSSLGDWGQPFKTLASIMDPEPTSTTDES